jgi:hypothetical protein
MGVPLGSVVLTPCLSWATVCARQGMNWPGCSFAAWKQSGHDRAGAVVDPLFVDPAGRDFRLRADSPALAIGIASIDLDVGPRQP